MTNVTNSLKCILMFTTGIAGFAECSTLCRVPFVGHSTKKALPSAALGKVRNSAKRRFAECQTLGKGPSTAVPKLTVVSHCREPTAGTRQRGFFAECHPGALGKEVFAECHL